MKDTIKKACLKYLTYLPLVADWTGHEQLVPGLLDRTNRLRKALDEGFGSYRDECFRVGSIIGDIQTSTTGGYDYLVELNQENPTLCHPLFPWPLMGVDTKVNSIIHNHALRYNVVNVGVCRLMKDLSGLDRFVDLYAQVKKVENGILDNLDSIDLIFGSDSDDKTKDFIRRSRGDFAEFYVGEEFKRKDEVRKILEEYGDFLKW